MVVADGRLAVIYRHPKTDYKIPSGGGGGSEGEEDYKGYKIERKKLGCRLGTSTHCRALSYKMQT